MADKEIKRLSRSELLELLVKLSEENEKLGKENEQLRKRLESRQISLENAGSIAEASLRINRVFEAVQAAADDYLASVKAMAAGEPPAENDGETA